MGEAQVVEGTTEEIMARLRDAYPEQNLRVTVEPQEEEPIVDWSDYPQTVTSEEQLVHLLRQSLTSPTQEVTEETWEQRRIEIRRCAADRRDDARK